MVKENETLPAVAPGELLRDDFLLPMGITQCGLAKAIGVSHRRISDIVALKRSVTIDTDLRLCKFFGLSDGYWLRVQNKYDAQSARRKIKAQPDKITPIAQAVGGVSCG
jgi:addiction module HigA family antidote